MGTGHNPCVVGLLEIKRALAKELEDEIAAASHYNEIAVQFNHYGYPAYANIFRTMAIDEISHHMSLQNVMSELDRECRAMSKTSRANYSGDWSRN
jgi:ferritin